MFYIRDYATVASQLPPAHPYHRRNLRTQSPCVIKLPALWRQGSPLLPLTSAPVVFPYPSYSIRRGSFFARCASARSLFRTLLRSAPLRSAVSAPCAFYVVQSHRQSARCNVERSPSLRGDKGCCVHTYTRGDAYTPNRSRLNNFVARLEKLSARGCRNPIK